MAGDLEDIIQMENLNWRKAAGDSIWNQRKENGNENDCCKIYIQLIANKIQYKINQHNSAGDKTGITVGIKAILSVPARWGVRDH